METLAQAVLKSLVAEVLGLIGPFPGFEKLKKTRSACAKGSYNTFSRGSCCRIKLLLHDVFVSNIHVAVFYLNN